MMYYKKYIIYFISIFSILLSKEFTFSDFPIQESGRIKPLDTYARNQLLRYSGKTSFNDEPALQFLLSLIDDDFAYNSKIFYINNPEVEKSYLGTDEINESHRYSIDDLRAGYQNYYKFIRPKLLDESFYVNNTDQQIKIVADNIDHLLLLKESLLVFKPIIYIDSDYINNIINNESENLISISEFITYQDTIISFIMNNEIDDNLKLDKTIEFLEIREQCRMQLYYFQTPDLKDNPDYFNSILNIVPSSEDNEKWNSPYFIIINNLMYEPYDLINYYNLNNDEIDLLKIFNDLLENPKDTLALSKYKDTIIKYDVNINKLILERAQNNINIFKYSLVAYLLVFILILINWILESFKIKVSSSIIPKVAFVVALLSFFAHTYGIITRMIIMERPPVSTLYESIIFVGFIIMLISLIIEWIRKDTLGLFVGTLGGIILHFIALKYANDGDTLGVLVAVLNSNFWLSIHVTTITFGYGVSLVTGLMAHLFLLQSSINPDNKKRLKIIFDNLYVLTFVALFFTLLGTILGGIWADQSWGRFWGWDPKENGALLIVMWHLLVLHLRVSGFVKHLGYAFVMSFINIIVALAWFGVNLLNVGLHSYGFTDSIALNLFIFIIIELLFLITTYTIAKIRLYKNMKSNTDR